MAAIVWVVVMFPVVAVAAVEVAAAPAVPAALAANDQLVVADPMDAVMCVSWRCGDTGSRMPVRDDWCCLCQGERGAEEGVLPDHRLGAAVAVNCTPLVAGELVAAARGNAAAAAAFLARMSRRESAVWAHL